MKRLRYNQTGFAMPAMFLAVAIGFVGSLFVKNDEGITLAEIMAGNSGKRSDLAVIETGEKVNHERTAEHE